MANRLYAAFGQALLDKTLGGALTGLAAKAALVTSAYTPNFATDTFMSTVQGTGGVLGRSGNLPGLTESAGTFNYTDTVLTPASGGTGMFVVFFIDTGNDATSRLICCDDTGVGLPWVAQATVTFPLKAPTGTNGLFQLPAAPPGNFMYANFAHLLLAQSLSAGFASLNIKTALVTNAYNPSAGNDQFMSTVQGTGGVLGRSANLTSITTTGGVFSHANTTITPATNGSGVGLLYFVDTGSDASSPLIAYNSQGSGLPWAATGGTSVTVAAGTGVNGVFRIPN